MTTEILSSVKTGDFYFQFNEEEPIHAGEVFNDDDISLVLSTSGGHKHPLIEFTDSNGKSFRIFINPIQHP